MYREEKEGTGSLDHVQGRVWLAVVVDAQLCAQQQQDGRQRAEARRFLEGPCGSKEHLLRDGISRFRQTKRPTDRPCSEAPPIKKPQAISTTTTCPTPTYGPEPFDASLPEQAWPGIAVGGCRCHMPASGQLEPASFPLGTFVIILPKLSKLNRSLSEAHHHGFRDFTRVPLAHTFM